MAECIGHAKVFFSIASGVIKDGKEGREGSELFRFGEFPAIHIFLFGTNWTHSSCFEAPVDMSQHTRVQGTSTVPSSREVREHRHARASDVQSHLQSLLSKMKADTADEAKE